MTKHEILTIIEDWKFFWMSQTQNSKEDYENYYRRAFGVDANMMHSLADRIEKALKAKESLPVAPDEASFSFEDRLVTNECRAWGRVESRMEHQSKSWCHATGFQAAIDWLRNDPTSLKLLAGDDSELVEALRRTLNWADGMYGRLLHGDKENINWSTIEFARDVLKRAVDAAPVTHTAPGEKK